MDDIATENFLLAEKLRSEDPEQFYTLVRMHLSFVLDLNTDDCDSNSEKKCKPLKWNLPFTKKQKPGTKNSSEGTALTADFIAQMQPIIQFLSQEENISQEGIFRRSGKVTRQQELKLLIHQGISLDFNSGQFSVHECASVLKNVLSELPESVLTDAHYPAYCQIAEFCGEKNLSNEERLLRSIQLLILLLPSENRKFFQDIIELLHRAVDHEDKNRMSADNLATLFTPHLLCPRRLSPEALHMNSQIMSRVVAFMIQKGSELFQIPPTVATDVRAYLTKKERRKLSPLKQMNESVCDGTAANTVFSFVDRERTAQENRTNPTETALAQLYAYIQSLPESSKKRKLIKQFNKENGYGTPLLAGGSKKRTKALNLGDSIKKHLSGFSKTGKKCSEQGPAGEDEEVMSPESVLLPLKKHQNGDDEKLKKENVLNIKQTLLNKASSSCSKKALTRKSETLRTSFDENSVANLRENMKRSNKFKSCETLDSRNVTVDVSCESNESLSRSHISPGRVVKPTIKRNSSSPVKKLSPCKSPRISEEHLTPVTSHTKQEHHHWSVGNLKTDNKINAKVDKIEKDLRINNLYKTPRKPVSNVLLRDGVSEGGDFNNFLKTPVQKFTNTNSACFLSPPNNTNRLPISYATKSSFLMTTSTPATGNGCLLTPIVDKSNSMSPITKSTRRMPKAMQETMMTPRSRKPVISLSGTDLCNLTDGGSSGGDSSSQGPKPKISNGSEKKLILGESNEEESNDSLSSTFRNYLFTRSVLTASPVDLSFSSRADDFLSLSDDKSSSEENENFKSLPEIINEGELTESLLYCLDGNDPESDSGGNDSEAKNCNYSSYSNCDENVRHVYETAL